MREPLRLGALTAVALVSTASSIAPGAAGATGPYESALHFGPPDAVQARDLVRDSAGNAYVVGVTFAAFDGFSNEQGIDSFVLKLAPDGDVVWVDQFGSDGDEEGAYAVALDEGGAVYVAGVTQADLHGTLEGYSDPYVRKYTADGDLVWGSQFFGAADAGNWVEYASDLAVAGSTVHVTGGVDGRGFLRRYDRSGSMLDHTEEVGVSLFAIATNGADVYVAGNRFDPETYEDRSGFVRRYRNGTTSEVPFAGIDEPMAIAVTEDAVFASGASHGEESATFLAAYTRERRESWTVATPGWDAQFGLAADDEGNVFGVGIVGETGDAYLRKHAPDGSTVWQVEDQSDWLGARGVTVDGPDVYVAGGSSAGGYVARFALRRTVPLTRLAGTDRVASAVSISRAAFPEGAAGVVLVSGSTFADAVVAGPLAASTGRPILLVVGDVLDPLVADELARLLPDGGPVTIVGGSAAVADAVEAGVRAAGFDVTRLAGSTRFETAIAVAEALGSPPAVIADGVGYADAIVAGAAAAHTGRAVVLTEGPSLPPVAREYLQAVGEGHTAVGGPAAFAAPGAQVLVGEDRYATAALVAARLYGDVHMLGVATGAGFADALALTPLLARRGAPLLLTPPDALAPQVADALGLGLHEVVLAGGDAAVAPAVAAAMSELLRE